MRKNQIIILVVIVTLAIIALCYFKFYKSASPVNKTNQENQSATTDNTSTSTRTVDVGGVTAEVSEGGNFTIEQVPTEEQIPVPDLNKSINFNSALDNVAKDQLTKNINTLRDNLKKDPKQPEVWMNLGSNLKMAGDYLQAASAWEYASKITLNDYVSFGNLGNLYGYYLKDNVKAEANYLQALKNGSQQVYLYFQVAEFYRDVLKNTSKAKSIIEDGIKVNPSSSELRDFLKTL
ncbi:MAG: hypothetical protein WCW87_00260 [Candidatus Paceibacterota bacterium]